jgi:hydrogenase maturation factor HypE
MTNDTQQRIARQRLDAIHEYLDARGLRRAEQDRIITWVIDAIHGLIRETPLIDGWDHVRAVRDLAESQGIELIWTDDEREGLGVFDENHE